MGLNFGDDGLYSRDDDLKIHFKGRLMWSNFLSVIFGTMGLQFRDDGLEFRDDGVKSEIQIQGSGTAFSTKNG